MGNVSHDVTSVTENGSCNVSHVYIREPHLTRFSFIISVHIFEIEGCVADGHWMAT